jgi:hypothetical protein
MENDLEIGAFISIVQTAIGIGLILGLKWVLEKISDVFILIRKKAKRIRFFKL